MDAGIRNYKIKLKILSPTYIGSGESYNRCEIILELGMKFVF